MPMYFPDLKSVQNLAHDMLKHQEPDKKYKGLIPKTEADLPQARKDLGHYLRTVWKDEIFALEVELALTKENYNEKIGIAMRSKFL